MDTSLQGNEENIALCLEINKAISNQSIEKSLKFTGVKTFIRENISPFDIPSPNLPQTAQDWEKSLEAQQFWFNQFMRRLKTYRTEPKIHLFLNAPLPLCFSLGIRLSNRYDCIVYQEDQEKGIHEPMNALSQESRGEPYWNIEGLPPDQTPSANTGPLTLGISITHDVSAQIDKSIPELGISEPIAKTYVEPRKGVGHDAIQPGEHHTALIEFTQIIDSLIYLWPNRAGIHLFYAGPASMAFLLGQRINMNVHYPISFYNFRVKYSHVFDSPFSNSSSYTSVNIEFQSINSQNKD